MSGPAFARAEPPREPFIAVRGEAAVSLPADYATLVIELRGEGDDRISALRQLEETRSRVIDGVSRLQGARAGVTSRQADVQPAYDPQCNDGRYGGRRATGACAPTGYIATMTVWADISPAERIGAAASLASELGASSASFRTGRLADHRAAYAAALQAAYADARRQAEAMAQASGMQLGEIIRLQDADVQLEDPEDQPQAAAIMVTGSRITRPTVELQAAVPPVAVEATVTAVFAIRPR
ncbi:SIMPL domain-containing protein [Brevundimonas sp. 2R-24]|uniref:SIMPL domain-containing protein n=2 Tax=Peiella sedimenti TaxID=3061083 RepID=A0ABT8SM35_9CAUL|nr:SIMPL domain-containing protein [Caulobacteraceae bacterium XZ-24]